VTNRLLNALPVQSRERLLSDATTEGLRAHSVLEEPGAPIASVFFPLTAVVELLAVADGESIEIATVGNEGIVGLPAVLGTDRSAMRSVVRADGDALRVPVSTLRTHMRDDEALRCMLRRFTLALMTQLGQSVVCNRVHRISERCARWLLQSHDRAPDGRIAVTQEYVAQMLGVRRASVTVAAGALQRAGAIRYSRGRIQVLDRAVLEREACTCYGVMRREYDRLLEPEDDIARRESAYPSFRAGTLCVSIRARLPARSPCPDDEWRSNSSVRPAR
jgi:CRP-like cAMP-binding protein